MNEVYFVISGPVVGKGRPRFTSKGGFARAYTPKKTTDYEKHVAMSYLIEGDRLQFKDLPVEIVINAYFEIPKSVSKKKKLQMIEGEITPTVKPDADNILKTIMDGLNNIAWNDDKQVVTATVNKFYSETPNCEVTIREVCYGKNSNNK